MENSSILDLFPTPLYITNINKPIEQRHLEYINTAPTIFNMGNTRGKDGYVLDLPIFAELKQFIMSHIKKYMQKVYGNNDIDVYMTQSWLNYTKPNEFHHKHSHPNSFLSGVFYINAIKGEDRIRFHKDKVPLFNFKTQQQNNYTSQEVSIMVETGDLVIFPSTFIHDVPQTTTNETRVSIAFNTFIRGYLGDEDSSTALYLN